MHNWTEAAISGRSEEALDTLRMESQTPGSRDLELAANSGFYAFWQLVVWAVYNPAGEHRLLEIALMWQRHSLKERETFAQTLRRKAVTVAEITGEENLLNFCESFAATLFARVSRTKH